MSDRFDSAVLQALRDHAMTYPETSEGASCVNRAFKVRKKNFAFLGEKDDGSCRVMVKLGPSLDRAQEVVGADPRFRLGKTGWATVEFPGDDPPDAAMLRNWIDESFRLLAPKTVVRQLD